MYRLITSAVCKNIEMSGKVVVLTVGRVLDNSRGWSAGLGGPASALSWGWLVVVGVTGVGVAVVTLKVWRDNQSYYKSRRKWANLKQGESL